MKMFTINHLWLCLLFSNRTERSSWTVAFAFNILIAFLQSSKVGGGLTPWRKCILFCCFLVGDIIVALFSPEWCHLYRIYLIPTLSCNYFVYTHFTICWTVWSSSTCISLMCHNFKGFFSWNLKASAFLAHSENLSALPSILQTVNTFLFFLWCVEFM